MKSILGWIKTKSILFTTYLVLLSAISSIYVYKQQSLIPGANRYEQRIVQRVENYNYPWRNVIDAPYVTSVWITAKTGITPLRSARIITALASVLSILMFYQLLRNWLLSPGKALVGTTLFATSSWMLAVGRGAHSVTVATFLLLLIFTLGTRLLFTTKPFYDWLFLVIATALALYSPVVVWLLFLTSAVSLFHYKQRQRSLPLKLWQKITIVCVGILFVTPLVIGIAQEPKQGLELLGMTNVSTSIPDIFLHVSDSVKAIFFRNPLASPITVGATALLDIFSIFMFLLGCYYFERRLSLKRSKMLFGTLFIGLIVTSLSGYDVMSLSLLLPLVYIFIAAGVHESISRWLNVFPKNPIARGLGVVMLAIAIGFTSSYHFSKIFLVRPGNQETRSFYEVK